MESTVSEDFETEIPQEIRELFNLQPNSMLEWEVKDGYAVIHPLPIETELEGESNAVAAPPPRHKCPG